MQQELVKVLRKGKTFKLGLKPKVTPLGAPLGHYTLVRCFGFEVPTVLAVLWAGLSTSSGLRVEGIFRTEPDVALRNKAIGQLQKGSLDSKTPPEVLSNLIKGFFRAMPGEGLLGSKGVDAVRAHRDGDPAAALLETLPPLERGLLQWLVRVMQETARFRGFSKMSLRNLSVVFAPNLSNVTTSDNPLEDLAVIEKTANALHSLCTERPT